MTRFKIHQHCTPNDRPGVSLEVDWITISATKGSPICTVDIGLNLEINTQYNEFVEFHEVMKLMDEWNDTMPIMIVRCPMTQNIENHQAYRLYEFEECRGIDIVPNGIKGFTMKFTCVLASMKTMLGNLKVGQVRTMQIL
jgi:hypothetical protein